MLHRKTLSRSLLYTLVICALLIPLVNVAARQSPPVEKPESISPIFYCYRTVEETFAAAQSLAQTYPDLAEWIDIGDSWEKINSGGSLGYDLFVLKLTNESNDFIEKPKALFVSGLHAGDFAPVELNLRLAEHLLANYGVDADVTWLLDTQEVHLILIANPDGRKIAEPGTAWVKNTNNNYCSSNPSYFGANLNRNFSFQWQEFLFECDNYYAGPFAQSEPETTAITAYINSQFPDMRGPGENDPVNVETSGLFINLRYFGSHVLWPYAYSYAPAPNAAELTTLGNKLAYFNEYTPDQASFTTAISGTALDFAYGELGIAAVEILMDPSGMQYCSAFENTIYPNNLSTLLYALKTAHRPYSIPSGPDVLNLNLVRGSETFGETYTLTAEINGTLYRDSSELTLPIRAAEYSIGLPPWHPQAITHPLQAVDGSFDTNVENATAIVSANGPKPGHFILYVRAQDQDLTWGAVSAVFIELNQGTYLPLVTK